MRYRVLISKRAEKFLDKLSKSQQEKILVALKNLPDVGDIKKMSGYDNFFRLRIGSFRIIYSIDNQNLIVEIIAIGNRGDIYKLI